MLNQRFGIGEFLINENNDPESGQKPKTQTKLERIGSINARFPDFQWYLEPRQACV